MRPPREIPYEIPQRCPYRPCCNPETRKQNPLLTPTKTLGTAQMGAKQSRRTAHVVLAHFGRSPGRAHPLLVGPIDAEPSLEKKKRVAESHSKSTSFFWGGYSKAHLAMEFNREPPPCMNDGKKRGRSQCGCGW